MIKHVREIFKNDIKAIIRNPVVMVVLFVIILLPSLYALLNIQATWDPYARTSNIEVAVVNEDLGYSANGTPYNIGNMVVDELKNNTKFSPIVSFKFNQAFYLFNKNVYNLKPEGIRIPKIYPLRKSPAIIRYC